MERHHEDELDIGRRVASIIDNARPLIQSSSIVTFSKFVSLSQVALENPGPEVWSAAIFGWEAALPPFQRALGELLYAAQRHPYRDYLGMVYMRVGRADKSSAQFFTPWSVARALVQMELAALDLDGFSPVSPLRVLDPACGSGTLLLATASELPTSFVASARLRLAGIDLDPLCVAMTRLNLRVHGLDGLADYVGQGDAMPRAVSTAPLLLRHSESA